MFLSGLVAKIKSMKSIHTMLYSSYFKSSTQFIKIVALKPNHSWTCPNKTFLSRCVNSNSLKHSISSFDGRIRNNMRGSARPSHNSTAEVQSQAWVWRNLWVYVKHTSGVWMIAEPWPHRKVWLWFSFKAVGCRRNGRRWLWQGVKICLTLLPDLHCSLS